ncbi:hypothetical protein HYQ46_000924 [Verticillium longisporum]|nr:hypothetical protein HYQ46_000924 [Verticillium longisporum]
MFFASSRWLRGVGGHVTACRLRWAKAGVGSVAVAIRRWHSLSGSAARLVDRVEGALLKNIGKLRHWMSVRL